ETRQAIFGDGSGASARGLACIQRQALAQGLIVERQSEAPALGADARREWEEHRYPPAASGIQSSQSGCGAGAGNEYADTARMGEGVGRRTRCRTPPRAIVLPHQGDGRGAPWIALRKQLMGEG